MKDQFKGENMYIVKKEIKGRIVEDLYTASESEARQRTLHLLLEENDKSYFIGEK